MTVELIQDKGGVNLKYQYLLRWSAPQRHPKLQVVSAPPSEEDVNTAQKCNALVHPVSLKELMLF